MSYQILKRRLVIDMSSHWVGRQFHQRILSQPWPAQWEFHHSKVTEFNTLTPRQDGRLFPDDIFKWIFLNENVWISIEISLKFVPEGQINNIPALVQIMAWRRPGDKPLSEPMMVSLLTHICVTRPQGVNSLWLSVDIWCQRTWSTLVQVMVCCLMVPSRYMKLNVN